MKLLLDQNLSRHLVRRLATQFPDSQHVAAVRLDVATDREVWDYAADHQYVIVSKDSDFRQLAFLLGPPPKAIWAQDRQSADFGDRRSSQWQRRRNRVVRRRRRVSAARLAGSRKLTSTISGRRLTSD